MPILSSSVVPVSCPGPKATLIRKGVAQVSTRQFPSSSSSFRSHSELPQCSRLQIPASLLPGCNRKSGKIPLSFWPLWSQQFVLLFESAGKSQDTLSIRFYSGVAIIVAPLCFYFISIILRIREEIDLTRGKHFTFYFSMYLWKLLLRGIQVDIIHEKK